MEITHRIMRNVKNNVKVTFENDVFVMTQGSSLIFKIIFPQLRSFTAMLGPISDLTATHLAPAKCETIYRCI